MLLFCLFYKLTTVVYVRLNGHSSLDIHLY